jgi:hypothetical protein
MDAQLVSDRIEIDDLLTLYAHAIDTRAWDLLDRVFTQDATVDYSTVGGTSGGYPEVKAWLEQMLASFEGYQHFITNRAVTVDGDTATARSYLLNPTSIGGGALMFVGGFYNDRLVRTPDGWRIAHRELESSWSWFPKQ